MIQDAFVRQRARQLYWQGYPPAEISRLMGINPNTIYAWKKRDQWDETPPVQRVTQSIDARLIQLTEKQNKTGGDFKEIDLLTRQLKKLHDGQPDVMAAGKKGRAKKLKNHFTPEQIAALREKIISRLEWHQRGWFDSLTLCREAGIRNRMILKSRQIGATWYFAQEALLMALRDDVAQPYQRNQIFLSASRRQAFQFKSIIQKAAAEVDVELKGGDKIILSNGAELHFLGTSAATAQSYTGNFYFDEFFWVSRFAELRKVAGAMATLSGRQPSADCGAPTSPRHPPKRTRHTPTGTATAGTRKRPRINASVFLWTGKRCITGLSALTGRGGKLSRWKMWLITAGNTPILTKFVMKTPKTSSAISICVSLSAKGNRHLT